MRFVVELGYGYETIVDAHNIELAKKWARAEFGRIMEPIVVRGATKEDVNWVEGMGGRIHKV